MSEGPTSAHLEWARRVLAQEGASGEPSDRVGAAAESVYQKLDAALTPILGAISMRLLLQRSAKLSLGEFEGFAESAVVGSKQLRDHLQALPDSAAAQVAEALFAGMLTLLARLIGERLTLQILRSVWPSLHERTETTK